MLHLCRRAVTRSTFARACGVADGSINASCSDLFVNTESGQLEGNRPESRLLHCICTSQATTGQHSSASPSKLQKPLHASFATKAEEYDLIVAEAGLVRIEGYDETGFIVNDVQVQGAVFCVNDLFMMWNVKSWQDLTPSSLNMLQLFKPAPDLVIIGCGLNSQMVPLELRNYFKEHNIAYEAIDTANAVSTFNILNQEGRKVAGVMLPAGST